MTFVTIDLDNLQKRLCSQLCATVQVVRRPHDGQLMLDSGFEFPDGDRYPIHLYEAPGGLRLSDDGDTLMRISFEHDIDEFFSGSRAALIERILAQGGLGRDGGTYYLDTPVDALAAALFRYGHAITRIYDLTLHPSVESGARWLDESIDATFLRHCIASLERTVEEIEQRDMDDDALYNMYRAACVKQFELVLEQSGKLLRKRLAAWFASHRQADRLDFKDLFRHAARHDLIGTDAVERWLGYRDNRSETARDHDEDFVEATLRLLPAFIEDAKALADVVEVGGDG